MSQRATVAITTAALLAGVVFVSAALRASSAGQEAGGKKTREGLLTAHRVREPALVIKGAKRTGLRLDHALAMLTLEIGFPQRNIFGCDEGPSPSRPPYCHHRVTEARVQRLRSSRYSNGIGWTQVTYKPLVRRYGARWGRMHLPAEQMKVGFTDLERLVRLHGARGGSRRYNGRGPIARRYDERFVKAARKWRRLLKRR